jgi:glycerate 2-kinase
LDSRLRKRKIRVACDVKNPLLGSKGTVNVYAKQKGATPSMLPILESGMKNLSKMIQKDLKISVARIPGSGAAGGLGAGLVAFCGAQIESGADLILDTLDFDKYLRQADLVITGEGKLDNQSAHGKAPVAVALRC